MTIFEKIIEREIPAYIVYEDDDVIAFLDISQATKGHTLVVPKKAYPNILEMPEDLLQKVILVTQKITKAINTAFQPSGINILNNTFETAGQTVFHFHIHILPRYDKNDVTFKFQNHMGTLEENAYKERALLIKKALL